MQLSDRASVGLVRSGCLSLGVVQSATRPRLVIQDICPRQLKTFENVFCDGHFLKDFSLLQDSIICTSSTGRVLGNTCVY